MSKAAKTRTRRHRRQGRQALKHGAKAKPTHKLKSGRTGALFRKQLAGRKFEADASNQQRGQ